MRQRIKSDREVAALIQTPGRHGDGGGLYLQVAAPGQASWVWRHREKWKSIGPADVISLTKARDKAHCARMAAHEGRDPFETFGRRPAEPTGKTFADAMSEYIALASPHWSASNRVRETRSYEFNFAMVPSLTALPVAAVDQAAIDKALTTWHGRPKIQRVMGSRIKAILRGTVRVRHTAEPEHHEAMTWHKVPAYFAQLAGRDTIESRALRFVILTACRTDELIGAKHKPPATWAEVVEIDGAPVWVIPAERMKAKRAHRIPLTAEALALLGKRKADAAPLFTLHQAAMLTLLRETEDSATVHGFRSSFRDWVAEATNYGRDLGELALAHDRRSKVEKAYQRSDLLEKRRPLMQGWSDHCAARR